MKNIDDIPMNNYIAIMASIVDRLNFMDPPLKQFVENGTISQIDFENAALQFRMIFEGIAIASFVANLPEYEKAQRELTGLAKARVVLREISRINPNFYPIPVREVVREGQPIQLIDLDEGYLTRNELEKYIEKCGHILHIRNPNKPPLDTTELTSQFLEWRLKIAKLLRTHKVTLLGDTGFYLIQMMPQGGRPIWHRFEKVDEA